MTDRWTSWALAAVALGAAALVITGIDPTQDDGYYYFQIARQVARGAGSTFDGLHPTSGYHPLWLLALVPVFAAIPGRAAAAQAALGFQGVLLAGAVAVAYGAARRRLPPAPAASAALVFLILALRPALGGLEFALHALAVAAVLALHEAWRAEGAGGVRRALLLGLALAAAFLARLDNLLLATVIGGAALGRRPRVSGRAWAALVVPTLLAAGAYAAVNLALFGHPMPVSGAAKRIWSAHLLSQDPVYQAQGFLAAKLAMVGGLLANVRYPLGLVLAVGSAGALALSLAPAASARVLKPLRPWALFALLQLAAYALLFHGQLSFARWYFVVPLLLAGLAAGALLALLPERLGTLAMVVLAVAALGSAVRWRVREAAGGPTAPLHDAARWIDGHLPREARVGSWNAGTLGYESGRTVVNLDGLANSRAYLEREQYDPCAYWARQGITHLADAFAEEGVPPRPVVVPVALPMPRYYAPCAHLLERVWEGRAPPDGSWRLRVYRIRWP